MTQTANAEKKQPKRYPPGSVLIAEGKCPIGASRPLACWFCQFGHATECHHPMDCRTANCSHFQRTASEEL